MESDITLYIEKSESVLASRLNCATYGDIFRLKHLIGAGADPNNTDYDGRSPLHIAASNGYQDITLFLSNKVSKSTLQFGNTRLLEAVKNGHDEVASTLVGAGATLAIDDAGNFLCMAVARKDLGLLKRALLTGTNPNAKNFDCRTPLHVAASEGLYSIASLLLEAGASVFSKDRWGHTPLDEALVGGDKNLIRLLEVATTSQTSGFSDRPQQIEEGGKAELQGRKCTVFPFHPWDSTEARRHGVVLWVPHTLEELVKRAMENLE